MVKHVQTVNHDITQTGVIITLDLADAERFAVFGSSIDTAITVDLEVSPNGNDHWKQRKQYGSVTEINDDDLTTGARYVRLNITSSASGTGDFAISAKGDK